MKKQNNDLSNVLTKAHENKWVALSLDQTTVVAFSDNFSDLEKKVDQTKKVTYIKVLPSDKLFAF